MPRKLQRIEQEHCVALMTWAALQSNMYPALNFLFHIPNGGKRTKVEAAILKRMGVKAGVWDYMLPVPRRFRGAIAIGLWLEMKRPGEKLSEEQAQWGDEMVRMGYATVVCDSWEHARDALLDYITGDGPIESQHRWPQ